MRVGSVEAPDFAARFRTGEPAALEEVYRKYVPHVAKAVSFLLRRHGGMGAKADVQDLVQECFARAFEASARERFDGLREYGPYVLGIAHHVVINHVRSLFRVAEVQMEAFPDVSTSMLPTQESDLANAHLEAMVGSYVERLPTELRQLHELIYVQGHSQREAAAALGIGRQTVRTLDARLRRGLRAELAKASRRP